MALSGWSTGDDVAALLLGPLPSTAADVALSNASNALSNATAYTGTVLVTGASSGLGQETARVLGARGWTVVVGVLPALLDAAVADLRARVPDGRFVPLALDLSSLDAVRAAADAYSSSAGADAPELDVLINNAGVMACPCTASADGYELQFAVNYLGHYALTRALVPLLARSRRPGGGRVVVVSSAAHALLTPAGTGLHWDRLGVHADVLRAAGTYNPWEAYGCSKLAAAMFAAELQRRSDAAGWGIVALALHPGAILGTGLKRFVGLGTVARMLAFPRLRAFVWGSERPITKSITQGVATTIYGALAPASVLTPGGYYANCKLVPHTDPYLLPMVHDPEAGTRLWTISEALSRPGAKATQAPASP